MENTQQNVEQFLIELEKSQNAPLFDKRFWAEALYNYANKLNKPCVSNLFSPEQMAEWFHNNYEEVAKVEGWQTQDKCKVKFNDLPVKNKNTMIKVCERWLNGC